MMAPDQADTGPLRPASSPSESSEEQGEEESKGGRDFSVFATCVYAARETISRTFHMNNVRIGTQFPRNVSVALRPNGGGVLVYSEKKRKPYPREDIY